MRIATFNMERGGSLGHWARALAATAADLFFAQESVDPLGLARESSEPWPALGPGATTWSVVPGRRRARWGSAVLVRSGAIESIAVPGFGGWVVGGKVSVGSASFHAFSVHIPSRPGASYEKLADRLVSRLARIVKGEQLLLGGDWNVTVGRRHPEEPKQNSRRELAWLDRLEGELGVVSAWQACHREQHLPQTLRWRRDPLPPYHCDGIFLPLPWVAELKSAEVLTGPEWAELSDHNPVVVEVERIETPQATSESAGARPGGPGA